MGSLCRRRCNTATETLDWMNAIKAFLTPYTFFLNAHVVNFFTDRLWEAVDNEWMDCLRVESVENLLKIPCGVVQEYWPASLKEFIITLRSLVFPREQAELNKILPDLHMTPLNNVLTLGMNLKKKHEVEVLAAIVSAVARSVGASTIVDVGAGQGYLAQVISFHYQHSVVAIDASSHHGSVTNSRAERIKKHYAAKSRSGSRSLRGPKTLTCRLLSPDSLKSLNDPLLCHDDVEKLKDNGEGVSDPSHNGLDTSKLPSSCDADKQATLLLAGLHACGDLSVTMLRTFLECIEVKAVVNIGCCYNLLSEEGFENACPQFGFPMSNGAKSIGLSLGKSPRDLACQSAERWRCLGKDAGLQNFELHTIRAAFQMVLYRFYPEVLVTSPSLGRRGKALRRQQQTKVVESLLQHDESTCSPLSPPLKHCNKNHPSMKSKEYEEADEISDLALEKVELHDLETCEAAISVSNSSLFEKFVKSGLCRLGLKPLEDVDFLRLWKETEPFSGYIGPYWSLRAALGPLIETYILLDRLLFLQEQDSLLEVVMLPIFNPLLSPRNVAIIAKKV